MNTRKNMLDSFYGQYDEDARLNVTRQGQLEYLVTMNYIHKYANDKSKIIEIGAGTGRYSIALAKEGMDVTAVELVQSNLDVLQEQSKGIANIVSYQGDATNLNRFEDNSFDVTLSLGPMYHLFNPDDVQKAIDEAIRITKPGGVILFAFLSVYAIMYTNYLHTGNWSRGEKFNFSEDYKPTHFENQLFTGYDIKEFENLFSEKPVEWLTTTGVDGVLEIIEKQGNYSISDEDFKDFVAWSINFAEKRELLGSSSHLLYICKKK